jgi:hypothetical protein
MARKTSDGDRLTLRASPDLLASLDEIARAYAPAGVTLSRTDALRFVVTTGLSALMTKTLKPVPG